MEMRKLNLDSIINREASWSFGDTICRHDFKIYWLFMVFLLNLETSMPFFFFGMLNIRNNFNIFKH